MRSLQKGPLSSLFRRLFGSATLENGDESDVAYEEDMLSEELGEGTVGERGTRGGEGGEGEERERERRRGATALGPSRRPRVV